MSSVLLLNLAWQISTLALVTLGLAIVFGKLQIMNMAHGEFVMIGAYSPVITASLGLGWFWQIPICLLNVALLAWLLERSIIRHFYGRMFDSLLATWGISILLRELVELVFGRGYQSVASPMPGSVDIFGTSYPAYRIAAMSLIVLGFVLLFWWNRKSQVATQIRAMVSNPSLAQSIGINTQRLSAGSFVFGCVTAGLAGLLLAPTIRIEPMIGLDYLVRSFFALVVGGLGSLDGLIIGTSVIAGTQTFMGALYSQTSGYLVVLLLSILFLWLKPNGIRSHSL